MGTINNRSGGLSREFSGTGRWWPGRDGGNGRLSSLAVVLLIGCGLMILLAALWPESRNLLSGAAQPLLSGGQRGWRGVGAGIRRLVPLSVMERRMLDDLQERVYQLQTELAVANQLVEENRQLRELLELAPPPGWHRMAALMIARDPILWNQRFRIDRGRVDGVLVGSLVMAGEQVVGRVVEISAASALVATLADPECRLSVRLPDSGATGLLYGGRDFQSESGRIVALIDYLPRDDVYSEGGLVETSGLSGFVPGGIEVGRIVAWNDQQVVELVDASFARLRVLPSVDLSGVRVVSVLLPAGG